MHRNVTQLPAILAWVLLATTPLRAADLRNTLDLLVPEPPTPVDVGGQTRLVYELHLTNFSEDEVLLERIEVLDARRGAVLASFADADLVAVLGHPGMRVSPPDPRLIGPGMRAVSYFWLTLPRGAPVPALIAHRLTLDLPKSTDTAALTTQGGTVVPRAGPPLVLGPPLRGGPWVAVYDPSMARGHRRVEFSVEGRAVVPARFAIDWFKVGDDGKLARDDKTVTANWYGYGADVLAVAKAVVRSVRDHMPESPLVSMTGPRKPLQDASGNFIVLDLNFGHYAFYEHLRPGSIRVHAGDHVVPGQVIASLGYTGDSSGPHLHFHVAEGASPLAAEGLPYVIRDFKVLGDYGSTAAFAAGHPWTAAQKHPDRRAREFPLANSVIRFAP